MILKKMKFSILSTLSAQCDGAPLCHSLMEQWRVMQEDHCCYLASLDYAADFNMVWAME